jgi:uncharacterized repeat protein (TIGR03803 family)
LSLTCLSMVAVVAVLSLADSEGALYGTASGGGAGGGGTVFKLTPPNEGAAVWTEAVLYSFCTMPKCSDGDLPNAGLILDDKGELYGTTCIGGINCPAGNGTVFKQTPPATARSGWTETVRTTRRLHAPTLGSFVET